MAGDRLHVDTLATSWVRSLKARDLSPKTVDLYASTTAQLAAFADDRRHDALTREVIEEYLPRPRRPA